MEIHSRIPAWETPWTEQPGRLQFMGSPRDRHDLAAKPPPHTDNKLFPQDPTITPLNITGGAMHKNMFGKKHTQRQLRRVAVVPKTTSAQPIGLNRLAIKQPATRAMV